MLIAPSQPRQLSLGELMGQGRVRLAQTAWRPAADVYETPDQIIVTSEIAGIDPDSLDVLLYADALVVEGQRRISQPREGVYQAAEIPQGPFRLEVAMPCQVDADRVDASYENGLLQITLDKAG